MALPMRHTARATARRVVSFYVLIPAVVVAATALATYSYRYARELARRGEQSILDTNRDLAESLVDRIETLLKDADRNVFDVIDFRNLREFARSDLFRSSNTIQSVVILDDHLKIVPDGAFSKRNKAEFDRFRAVLERRIVPLLDLPRLAPDEHRYFHGTLEGEDTLISYTRRRMERRDHFVLLEGDLDYIVSDVFYAVFKDVDRRRVYQVFDQDGALVYGFNALGVPERYVVSLPFADTLSGWGLRMAPREAPTILEQSSKRRAFDVVLIVLSAATIFVGLGVLTLAVRAERRANQLKSDFIANVSHELKTPLSLIRMFGELLATGRAKGPESAREYAEIITRESERLSRLIDNVLDFARIERGKVAYDFAVGDLAEVLARGLDVYRYRLEREGIKLVVDLADDLPPVRMDENAIMLVLLNLVDNAVKYAADGKELAVSLRRKGDRVVLTVRDRGPGIVADEQGRIFERFYRARSVRGRPVRGSGIGLSLVKHIAEAHGGGVSVDSVEGKGSAFVVWLPVSAEPDPAAPPDKKVETEAA